MLLIKHIDYLTLRATKGACFTVYAVCASVKKWFLLVCWSCVSLHQLVTVTWNGRIRAESVSLLAGFLLMLTWTLNSNSATWKYWGNRGKMSFEIIQRISKTEYCLHVLTLTNVKSTLFLRFLPLHKLKNGKRLKVLSHIKEIVRMLKMRL